MAEAIHTESNMMTEARHTQGEREERIVDIYGSFERPRDQHQDDVGTEDSSMFLRTVRSQLPDAVSRLRCLMVVLGLLSVVLLTALLGWAVHYNREMEQVLQKLNRASQNVEYRQCCRQVNSV